jgi:drug/metabolite transporter (DMT)-like permease
MVEWLWIPITVAAALFQCLRLALQRFLKGRLSTSASNFTRFAFGMPVAIAYLLGLLFGLGYTVPRIDQTFLAWVVAGGLAQIVATGLLLHVFSFRNFPVGIAYAKTEVIQAAVFGLVFLGDRLTAWGSASILVSTLGVMLVSLVASDRPLRALLGGWMERSALIGIASGGFFAVSAVGFRAASLSLEHPSPIVAAACTLAFATTFQSAALGAYLAWREPDQFAKLAQAWRPSLLAGLTSVLGSAGWFTAMTLQAVAYVRTLGLVELLFTFLVSALWFREKPRPTEIAGVVLVVAGIAMILNAPR